MVNENKLYTEIELAIIKWSNDGTLTAGALTREIIELINKNSSVPNDPDFMYKWITKHSGRELK